MAKQEGKDKISKLHGYLVEAYDSTPKDVNSFRELMQDEAYAEKIHKALVADEDVEITKDYNTFADNYGLKKKAVSPTSATTSKPSISQPAVTSQASGTQPAQQAKATSQPIAQEPTKDPLALIRSGLSKRFKDPNGLTNATEADLKRYAARHIEDLRDKKESPLTADELNAILTYALPKNQTGAKELLEKEIARKRAASGTQPVAKQPKPLLYDPEKERIAANQRSEQLQTNPEIKKKEREQLLSTAIDSPEKLKRYQIKEAEAFLDENKDKDPYYATKKEKIKKALGDTGQSQASDLTNRFFKGIVQLVPDASNTVAIMAKKLEDAMGGNKPLTEYQTRQWGIAAQELIDSNLVTNQYFDEDELSMLSNGLGQVVSTVGLALLTKGGSAEAQALRGAATLPEIATAAAKNTAGLRTAAKEIARREIPKVASKVFSEQSLTKTALETLGKSTRRIAVEAAAGVPAKLLNPASLAAGSQVFASTFEEATKAGAGFDEAFKVSAKNAGLTTTLAILPMEAILKSAEGIGKISLKEYTKNAIKAAGTEGLTEGFEQYYANLNAQETYDLNRKLMDGVLLNAKAGGVIGGFMSSFLGLKNLSLKKANETNDPRLKAQAEEIGKILPKDLSDEITPREELPINNTGNQRGEPELMPNVPVNTQQALGKKIIRRKQQGETDKFVEVEETYENQPNERDASEQEQNLIKEGVITIDTTQQPVETAPVEDPIQTAQTILNTADTSGGPVTAIQVGQAADAITKAVDAIEGKATTPQTGQIQIVGQAELDAFDKKLKEDFANGLIDAEGNPITQKPAVDLAAEGISTEPITDGERPTRTLEGIYVTPETDAQILYQSNKGGTLLKQPDGSLTAVGNQSVKELLQEAAENDPVIFDNGRSVEVDTDNITSEQEMFDALMQSDNPIDIADAYTYAEGMPSEVISNAGSREQALSNLIYNLTPADLSRYGKGDITQYPEWVQKIVNRNKDKTKSTIDVDIQADEYENFGFTPEDVTDHVEFLSGLGEKEGPKKLRELLSDEEIEVNTARDEAAQRFQELTGAKLTPELARTIANSNPRQEQTVYGQDEEGNLLFSEPRTQVDKGEIAPETDKFRGLTKRQVNQRKVKDKTTKRVEEFAKGKLDALAAVTAKSDIQAALDKVKDLWNNGGIVPITMNSGGFAMLTPQAKAALSELIRAIKASGVKKVKDIAKQLYDSLPDNIKGNTTATDFEQLVEEVLGTDSDKELKEAVEALVKLYKQLNPTKIYEKAPVYKFIKDRIKDAVGELEINVLGNIEKYTDQALNPKPKDRFDPTLTGKKKTTKQVLGIPINPVLQRLIDIGKVVVNYKPYSNDQGFADAKEFIRNSSMQEILDYLDAKNFEDKYTFVAKLMEDHFLDLMAMATSKSEIATLGELYAQVFNNRKIALNQAGRVLQSGKIFKGATDTEEEIEVTRLRLENAKKLKERLAANDKKDGIELAQAEAKRIVDEEQANLAKDLEMAKKDALLEAYKQALAKVRRQLGQKELENKGLRSTTPETAEELEREINKLNKVIIEQASKAKKAPSTTSKAKETTTKVPNQVKKEAENIKELFKAGKLFDKGVARSGFIPVLSTEGEAAIKAFVKAVAKEVGYKVQAIAERLYNELPQELKDITTAKDWEEKVAQIQGEAYNETVGDGVEALNQRISNDVQERILKGEQKPKDAIEDVIAELYKIYRERTIASDKKPIQPKTANELIAELLSQTEQARSVWAEVQSTIINKYGNQPKVMEALAEYFDEYFTDSRLKLPVSKKKVKQAVKEYFQNRGATLEELIRDRVRIEKETGANTRQAILNVMPDLPIDLVNDIVNAIETETEAQAKVTADRIIDRYFDDTVTSNREPKPIQVQILSDIALANYADKGRVIEGINRKYGTDIRTEEELTDLEVALDNATTPTQVREALTDFARWTPEGAKLAGRVTKTEANRIGEAENNTGLDPVSLTLKALHDVAKQNKTVEAATKKEPNNVIDTMRAVLDMQNKGDAALIWETAKAIVNRELEAKFANDPEGLANAKQQIAEYFGHTPLEMAIPKKDFAKAVNQKLKELLKGKTVEQAIMDYDNIQEQVNVSVTEMLTDGMGLDPSIAAEIATQVENATQERINRAAQNIAKRLQPKLPKAKAARTPLAVRIAQALALKGKGVTDEEINKIIEERYGVFIPESALNGLEIAAKEAAVAFKEGGATSTAYKAAAQRFEIELAKATKDTKLEKLEKLNTATNAALLSGPAGRIADVVSNIALTAIELAKTGLEIPLNFKKADWKRWKAKLRFAQVVGQGAKQGSKIAKLQLQGKITDINRYTADSSRNIEAMIERSTGLPKAYLKAGKWVYRIMAATDSLFASEIAYQKALFDLIIATNQNTGNMSVDEMAEDALQQMYGNKESQDNAAFKAYVETFGQAPTGTTQADIDQEAKTAKGGDKDVYQARKLEILQNGIDESIKNEARRTANIQAYKGEQFGTLGLLSDKITQFTKGVYPLENISRFSGTAFKIMNTMLDYSLYGFVRASGRSLGNTVLFKGAINKTGGRVLGVRTQTDPNQKLDPETKKAIEKAYRRQQLGRAIFGTILGSAIPALFASLGDEDDPRDNYIDIIGNMDAYPRQYRELLKQAGVKPNSVKIGDVYISFEYILPLALTFAITANGKDLQRAARKLKEANPEKYKDVTDESINTWYEYMITQYTNPEAIASSFNSMIAQSPLRSFSEGLSTVGDIFKKEAEIDDLVSELAKGLYKQFTNVVIPKIMADFAKYTAIGLDKAGVTDVGAMAMNSKDNDFFTTLAYMSSLGDVTTGAGLTNPKRKIDAFGNIFEKEPNEYRMPVKVFERKFATEPIIQLQIASGVVKMPARKAQYPTLKKGKEVTKQELNEQELYDMNLQAGKAAKAAYLPTYIQEDMALLETDKPRAIARIKKTSEAVLEHARLEYLYNKFMKDNSAIPNSVKIFQQSEIKKAYRNIFKARNTK